MVDFIHNNKDLYGVDAICRILPIAASTYYRTLDLCENPEHRAKRDLHDLHHAEEIKRIWKESSGRYGVRKVWQKLKREGYVIARCTVARLMQKLGIQGVWRGKNKQTTRSRDDQKKTIKIKKHGRLSVSLFRYGLDYVQMAILRLIGFGKKEEFKKVLAILRKKKPDRTRAL